MQSSRLPSKASPLRPTPQVPNLEGKGLWSSFSRWKEELQVPRFLWAEGAGDSVAEPVT